MGRGLDWNIILESKTGRMIHPVLLSKADV
jgi:hypothetical protein